MALVYGNEALNTIGTKGNVDIFDTGSQSQPSYSMDLSSRFRNVTS